MHAPLRALLCALPLLAYAASSPTPAFAYDDAGYLAYADRMQERLDGLWNEQRGIYEPGPGGVDALVNAGLLLDPQRRRAGRTPGASAQRPPRAAGREGARDRARVHRPPPQPPTGRLADPRAGLVELDVHDRRRPASRLRRRDRRRSRPRVEGAQGARPPGRDGADDRRPHPPRRAHALLALADDPAQPGQLVRAGVRGRRDRVRQLRAAAARHARAARALRLRPAQLRPRPALPVPPALRQLRARERRLGRVREHRPLVPALLQPGPASGDGAAAARRPRARPALDPPRDGGLLDARGLHELGQRPRLRALAPGQEARPRPAGADRDRADAAAAAGARVGALGEVDARPRAALLRAAAGAGGAACRTRCCSSSSRCRRRSGARGSPPCGSRPTRRARSRPGWGGCAASARRRSTPTTPTSAGSRSPRRPTTRRSSR